ncbi:PTS system IIA component (Glc family) [Salsuginibacillus halophilus]|uniref:PTS system IIA component (Glc family) n=1 Tax=Salsuginibacillus halophilus TaxID=517424 RepID=A0A2P8HAR7_9BACI|nr:PTS glucose transporter subunit IIA [Salsuginibacillus halophilus]PSL43271.1 PTS system IIA component (Glc family) [Salsuginibacillus halophilus]
MLKKLFGKKSEPAQVQVKSPANGSFVSLTEVDDPTFSEKMMGDGFAVAPADGKIVSPVKGKITQVFPTKHAVGIRSDEGLDVLVHIGLETVSMNGDGFEAHVGEGDSVNAGDLMVEFDVDKVNEQAKSTTTPVVFTEGDQITSIDVESVTDVSAGETLVANVTVNPS